MDFTTFLLGHIAVIAPMIGALLAIGIAVLLLVRSRAFLALPHRRTKLAYSVGIGCLFLGIILLISWLAITTIHEGKLLNQSNLTILEAVGIWFVILTVIVYVAALQGVRIVQRNQ
ncbi:MAG TPA: hypothetical protein VFA41_06725 [Ktedonobacteraceae bacterium]|jgi:hypothetical protein|nr:hypothetical protein [Ktedonobacteraceae bacterium]